MVSFIVSESLHSPLSERDVEICERKGIGHPDTICDSIMNGISIAICREYLRHFGFILHHNIDKGLLVAGEAETAFGGGEVKSPMLLIIGDRATFRGDGDEIPIDKIAIETAKKWFRENLRFVNPAVHVKYQVELKPGSEELISIFKRTKGFLGANDTSAAVGYAPMTPLEKLVLSLENYLNSSDFKSEFPETGEDVKVMGLRVKDDIDITIAMPFIDRYVDSEKTYFRLKSEVLEEINQHLEKTIGKSVKVNFNALDSPGKGVNGVYLTVLGTSAEAGDSGEVGRGNRVNGIIPLNRPTSSEAAAGKNPISHVGKIYNILSYRLAERVYSSVDGVKEIYVWLLSQIGEPIHQPKIVAAEVTLEKNVSLNSVKKRIEETLRSGLSEENLSRFLEDLIQGRIRVC